MSDCLCGCGEVVNPGRRYVLGHYGNTVENREHLRLLSLSQRGREISKEQKAAISRANRGEGNGNWKEQMGGRWHPGELAHWHKTGICEECGEVRGTSGRGVGTEWSFLLHPAPHTRNRSDYRELCRSCHMLYDLSIGARSHSQLEKARRVLREKHG